MNKNSVCTNYFLNIDNPSLHYIDIKIEVLNNGIESEYIDFILPVWRSGRYLVFDFSSGIQDFNAVDNFNNKLKWFKTNKNTWRVYHGNSSSVSVIYKVYANEFSLRTRGLDENHAFINGSSVFMYINEYRNKPLALTVSPYENWKISTGLELKNGFNNVFSAPGYDYFIDSPLEIGNQKEYEFTIEGRKHVISFTGEAEYDINRIINDFSVIIRKNFEFWGEVPYDKYLFIIHCSPTGSGGTEHINSTVVGVRPDAFKSETGYKSFLRLISHEFFHTWNVKQLKPAGLTPYDYTKENYTSELWIAEGGTSYYDGLMLLRCNLLNEKDFYDEIIRAVFDERRRPGYRIQSAADSSFDAWVKFWRGNPNAYNSESDYYAMGSYICMVLDLQIRNASGNNHSLDDVFKSMFEKFPLDIKGYTNMDFMKTCEEFADADLSWFFNDHVYGTKSIEWEKYLLYAGLLLIKNNSPKQNVIGLIPGKTGNNIRVTGVLPGSAADRAGIIKGDEIIALDGIKLSLDDMEKKINLMNSGDKIEFIVFRGDKLLKFPVRMEEYYADSYRVEKVKNPAELQIAIYEKWLGINW